MNSALSVTLLLLIPALILLNVDFSIEKNALRVIGKIGDRTSAREKFQEIGLVDERHYENFRLKQCVLIAILSLLIFLYSLYRQTSLMQMVGFTLSGSTFIVFYTERALRNRVGEYRDHIESDFPAIIEMMTLALSAGETPISSMQRIARRGSGPLAKEFSGVVSKVTTGIPFHQALDAMGRRIHSITVRRFVDSLIIAINRGAPLIDVLHSQSIEARAHQRNRVLSAAAKSEVLMMIPVVFLILPISILFALWPSLTNLNLFATG